MINPEDYDFPVPGEKAPEPEDVFEPAMIGPNFQAFADLVCLMAQEFGCQYDATVEELGKTKGWSIQLLFNAKTRTLRVKAQHPDNIWDKATPGVEAGHA